MKHLITLAVAFSPMPLHAQTAMVGMTGNQLYEHCKSKDANDLNACYGYILGVVDVNWIFAKSAKPVLPIADGVTGEQIKDIVVRHLEAHPEERHLPASFIAYMAIKLAFKDMQ